MGKVNLLHHQLLDVTVSRLSTQIAEHHGDFSRSVILGMQPRGIYLAERIRKKLLQFYQTDLPIGQLDATFFRDDFRRRPDPLVPNTTSIPFLIEGKRVILVDDVLYTGRTIRAALSAMMDFGRPDSVELLALIDRKYSRDLPIQPDYIGKVVNTIQSQRVIVEWTEQGFTEDNIWLVNKD